MGQRERERGWRERVEKKVVESLTMVALGRGWEARNTSHLSQTRSNHMTLLLRSCMTWTGIGGTGGRPIYPRSGIQPCSLDLM